MLEAVTALIFATFLFPSVVFRRTVQTPLIKIVHNTTEYYRQRTRDGVRNARIVFIRALVFALATSLLVWLAILMYAVFYYAYVPEILHHRPVHLNFKACDKWNGCEAAKGLCSFPSAHIQLTKRQQLLMQGQPYHIHLDLEMPESPTNKELGMFMVCAEFISRNGNQVANSCRSTMLHYKSQLLDVIHKLVFGVFFILGTSEEKQHINVELFSEYVEHEGEPVTDIYIEIQSMHIELYSAKFFIEANFTGLRSFMYNWPLTSAFIGITSNLVFIIFLSIFSWRQIIQSEEYAAYKSSATKANDSKDSDTGSTTSSIGDDISIVDEKSLSVQDIEHSVEDIAESSC